jgi:exonuclease VII small subunit
VDEDRLRKIEAGANCVLTAEDAGEVDIPLVGEQLIELVAEVRRLREDLATADEINRGLNATLIVAVEGKIVEKNAEVRRLRAEVERLQTSLQTEREVNTLHCEAQNDLEDRVERLERENLALRDALEDYKAGASAEAHGGDDARAEVRRLRCWLSAIDNGTERIDEPCGWCLEIQGWARQALGGTPCDGAIFLEAQPDPEP